MRTLVCVTLLVSIGASGACSSRGLTIGGDAVRDLTVVPTNNFDLAGDGCMQLNVWPNNDDEFPLSTYFTPNYGGESIDDSTMEGFNQSANGNSNDINIFTAEVDVPAGMPPAYPATVTFSGQTTLFAPATFGASSASEASVYVYVNCDLTQDCNNSDLELYVAQGGTLTMQEVDDSPNGAMAVSASNLHLLQWSTDPNAPDSPLPNGKCVDIASFIGGAPYTSQGPDFGTPVDFGTIDLATPVDLATRD